jgi:hypothetical protein
MPEQTDPLLSLKEKAEKATPGPWVQQNARFVVAYGSVDTFDGPVLGAVARIYDTDKTDLEGRNWQAGGSTEANAAFISAFNPKVAIALVGALIEARETAENIASGTEDALPPFRGMGAEQMRQLAQKLLSTLNTLGDGHVR